MGRELQDPALHWPVTSAILKSQLRNRALSEFDVLARTLESVIRLIQTYHQCDPISFIAR